MGLYIRIKRYFQTMKGNVIGVIALIIAALSLYFQFFNKNHSLVYGILDLEFNNRKEITVPLFFKNDGNQTEVVLNAYLSLEVRGDTSSNFKRISDLKPGNFPIILSPNESKLIKIVGNYEDYFFGLVEYHLDENFRPINFEYIPIKNYDSLSLCIELSYLTKNGTYATENITIGEITFSENEEIMQANYEPVSLKKLDLQKWGIEYLEMRYMPTEFKQDLTFSLNDTNAIVENYDKLLLINKLLENNKKKVGEE